MYKKLIILCLALVVVGLSVPASAASSLGWWNEGAPGTTHQSWDFTPAHVTYNIGDGYAATPESVISPNPGAVVATISPGDTYDGITKFTADEFLSVSLELPNHEILNYYKEIWVDIGNAVVKNKNIGITAIGDIPSTEYRCEILPGQGVAEFGIRIWPNPYVEKITMYFGAGTVLDYIHVDTICTPEPATVALLGLGGLALLRRKRAN